MILQLFVIIVSGISPGILDIDVGDVGDVVDDGNTTVVSLWIGFILLMFQNRYSN